MIFLSKHINFYILVSYIQKPSRNLHPSEALRSLWIQTLRSPTIVCLLSAAVPQEIYPHATPEALVFFCCHQFRERGIKKIRFPQISLVPRANSSSVQQKVRLSAWYRQCRSIGIYCWVWVPPLHHKNWATLNARKDRSHSGLPFRMQCPRMVCS